jgi:DNA topoisomerase IA
VQEHCFQTNGKVLVKPGWMAVYGKEAQDEEGDDTWWRCSLAKSVQQRRTWLVNAL